MDAVTTKPKKRKMLTLRMPVPDQPYSKTPDHVDRSLAKFLVWNEDGEMPKRLYDEPQLACMHAKRLSKETGSRFHVFRSWRIFEPRQ